MTPKMLSTLLATLCLVSASLVHAATPRDPYSHFFEDSFGDYAEELERARDEGKKGVLLFFEMDECPFCHRMKSTVLNQPEVQDYYRAHFLCFSIDIEGDVDIVDFDGNELSQKRFATETNRVRATPVFAFYDLQGEQVVRYTGATSGVQEFIWLGEFVAGEHYRNERFTRYKRARKKQQSAQ